MPPDFLFASQFDNLRVYVFQSNAKLGLAAAHAAAEKIQLTLASHGVANLILATGNSQLTFLQAIRALPIDWSRINIFHMDEYVGLQRGHLASFPEFLKIHLVDHIKPRGFYPIDASQGDPKSICDAYAQLLKSFPPDLCILGIGENGHIAFNDPPFADFHDPYWVKPVKLDQRSRLQQVNEGHFSSLSQVPSHAVTLTIPALLSASHMLCLVPEARKAEAVQKTLLGPIQPACPASILRQTAHCQLFLDIDSASEVMHAIKSCT